MLQRHGTISLPAMPLMIRRLDDTDILCVQAADLGTIRVDNPTACFFGGPFTRLTSVVTNLSAFVSLPSDNGLNVPSRTVLSDKVTLVGLSKQGQIPMTQCELRPAGGTAQSMTLHSSRKSRRPIQTGVSERHLRRLSGQASQRRRPGRSPCVAGLCTFNAASLAPRRKNEPWPSSPESPSTPASGRPWRRSIVEQCRRRPSRPDQIAAGLAGRTTKPMEFPPPQVRTPASVAASDQKMPQ